jgi:hypothetical protein
MLQDSGTGFGPSFHKAVENSNCDGLVKEPEEVFIRILFY